MVVEACVVAIDLAFTVLLTWLAIPVGHSYHYWAPFLLLIAGYLLGMLIMWCVLFLFALPVNRKKKYTKPMKWANFWLTESIAYICNHGTKCRVKVHYNEPLPNERFLLVCNHISKFDPMVLTKLYGHRGLAFISKPTNFKIPIGGRFMVGDCYLSIDRYDKLQSLQVMNDAAELIKNDYMSVGVFPEGTRSLDGTLGNFHEGVFSIAKKAKCPIVVMTVKDTIKIHENFPFKKTRVKFDLLKVLYPEDYENKITKQISDEVYQMMYNNLYN